MAKIAATDNTAMNKLFALEATKAGSKVAAGDVQAFEDHKDYVSTLESILSDDKKTSWSPNDLLLD
jgi:hypothetical protein